MKYITLTLAFILWLFSILAGYILDCNRLPLDTWPYPIIATIGALFGLWAASNITSLGWVSNDENAASFKRFSADYYQLSQLFSEAKSELILEKKTRNALGAQRQELSDGWQLLQATWPEVEYDTESPEQAAKHIVASFERAQNVLRQIADRELWKDGKHFYPSQLAEDCLLEIHTIKDTKTEAKL